MIATSKDKPILLRCPEKVLRRIDHAAKASGRSRNTEILMRLLGSFQQQPSQPK